MQVKRLLWLTVLVVAAFAGLGYRLVDLQVLRHEELKSKADQNTQQEFLLEARRGDVRDIKGNVLATSVRVKKVCADPSLIGDKHAEVARVLAPLLQENPSRLADRLQPRLRTNSVGKLVTNQFVILKRRVPVETWEKIQAAMKQLSPAVDPAKLSKAERTFYAALRTKAIYARDEHMRTYPNGKLASHVVGYASAEDREVIDTAVSEIVGREGIELTFNSKLAGVMGWRLTETDRRKRELVSLREQDVEPRDGCHLVLTLDAVIQNIVETHLAEAMAKHSPLSASAIVVRPKTGEVLALATLPDYDPNSPGKVGPECRRNRVVTDIMEPGSTFKIVPVSGALNDHRVTLSEVFHCEHGRFHFGGRILHDHESYGPLSTEAIITKSSNIGAAKIGIKLGENRLYEYMRDFGFGSPTGIELPGEVPGQVHPVKKWSKVSIAQIPMGHGVSVTRLQMIMAMCAIANQGVLMRPMLVDRLEDSEGHVVAKYTPQRVRRVLSEKAASQMVTALKTVTTAEGTAPKAALEHYVTAGKTGTAQKVENGAYVRKYFASFIGFFPADNPELCISVVLDEPKANGYYGGQTAAPIFKQIAERAANYLNIRPDHPGESPVPGAVAAMHEARGPNASSGN